MKSFVEDEGIPSLAFGQAKTPEELTQERNEHILRTGTKPRPWSHTALDNFNTCPKQYHEVKVLKRWPDEKGEAAIWGDRVHLALEAYLKGEKDLEPEMEAFRPYAERIKAKPGVMHVELEMCLNSKLQPCKPFDPGVFVRGYADVVHVNGTSAEVIDHKTGKIKPGSRQMKLMALLAFAHFPAVRRIVTAFEWLKFGKTDSEVFQRADIPELWNEFLPSLKQFRDAFATDTWQPRQSGLCSGWCPVSDCAYWRPKRVKK